jgi:two-component system sensor histidine kinase KdpD
LLDGLEILPQRQIDHRGVALTEFDLDGALARRPQLIIVDELAHSNAPGSRHAKRWQDIDELLAAGINVYTAVNIQHLESLNDVVAQIAGIVVRETVPDSFLEEADEVELVDIPPEELQQRLREGKVYVAEQAERALDSFFRKGNLIALRELALRHTADHVEAEMQSYRTSHAVHDMWPTAQRIVVCIAPNKLAPRVVRAARRLSASMHAELLAVFVESHRHSGLAPRDRGRAFEALALAESMGVETVTLGGEDIVGEIIRFAHSKNASIVVVGKPVRKRMRELLFGSVVDDLVRRSGDLDIYVITGEGAAATPRPKMGLSDRPTWPRIGWAVGITLFATALAGLMSPVFQPSNLVMVYLLGVAYISSRFGPVEAGLSSFLSVALFDFFFVPPRGSFGVSDTQYILTFLVMLSVGLLISSITSRMKVQAHAASDRERRTAALYALSREMSKSRSKTEIGQAARAKLGDVFDADVGVLIVTDDRGLRPIAQSDSGFELGNSELAVAQWVLDHGQTAGAGTDTLPGSDGLYLPLQGARGAVGVLALNLSVLEGKLDLEQMHLLETFANQLALAMERTILAKESHNARLQMESERLRNTLLNSVSHDLRTPLTSIEGAAGSLLENPDAPEASKLELIKTIYEEADRLNRLVRNLLDMTRLESGAVELNRQWHSIEELIGAALQRTDSLLAKRKVTTSIEPDLPLIRVDGVLLEQVLINLLENAARHTQEGSPIEIRAKLSGGFMRVEVADSGPGIPLGEENDIFEKFTRGKQAKPGTGFGLGLTICRSILAAHEGRIWGRNRSEGGANFIFELPIESAQPEVPVEA